MKLTRKIGYGIGDMGAGIMWGLVSSFLLIYMTDSVGMAAATLGTIILLTRVFDGVSDAIMGTIIDKTNTRMGKAKPWYLGSIIPLTISFILLFNIPGTMSEGTLNVYFFIIYFTLTVIFYTIKDVSYNALPALVTDSTKDRISMSIIRFVLSLTTSIVMSVITMPVINSLGGVSSQAAWSKITIVFAVIGVITLTISALSVKEMNIGSGTDEVKKEKSSLPFYKAFAYTFTNKYFIMGLVTTLASMTRIALMAGGVYYATYVIGNVDVVGLLSIAALLPMIIGMFLGKPFINRLGMQKTNQIGFFISLAGALISAVFANNLTLVLVGMALVALGFGPATATGAALLSHVADYGEWKHHVKLQGVTFSCSSIATKVGTGLGGALIGWGLQAGGYVAGATEQTAMTILMIKGVFLYIPVLLCAIPFVISFFMDIEYKMPAIKEELAKRNNEK